MRHAALWTQKNNQPTSKNVQRNNSSLVRIDFKGQHGRRAGRVLVYNQHSWRLPKFSKTIDNAYSRPFMGDWKVSWDPPYISAVLEKPIPTSYFIVVRNRHSNMGKTNQSYSVKVQSGLNRAAEPSRNQVMRSIQAKSSQQPNLNFFRQGVLNELLQSWL